MLDIKFIRENPELVRKASRDKNDPADVDKILELDKKRRELIVDAETLRAEQNKASQEISRVKQAGGDVSQAVAAMKEVAERYGKLSGQVKEAEDEMNGLIIKVPNIPHPSVPVGPDEEHNVTMREWGEKPKFDFKPASHWELGETLDMLDLPRGAKTGGSGFYVLRGRGARLERALVNMMLDYHINKFGFTEIAPPFLARPEVMTGTGQLPKLADDMYYVERDDLYLIPTAEVPVTNLHREEILSGEVLPLKYVAFTPCFRREAGSAGKDTRGILRVHQFNKVEMVTIVRPENSYEVLEQLTCQAEGVLQLLNLPYRVRLLATGDLSFAAAKCYDLEVYSAGVDKYLEVSSVSNFEDFQARRMNLRFRDEGEKPRYPHTLNGSGLALPRLMIALMENNQNEKGQVIIPEALRPYLDGLDIIT